MSELNTDIEKARARMLKLLALANQGVGDEAGNARRFLDKLLTTHGMTEADLIGEQKPQRYTFTYRDRAYHDLLVQVLCKVMKSPKLDTMSRKGRKELMLDLTPAQHIEVECLLSVYRPALKKHMQAAFLAFVVANRITSGKPAEADDDKPAKPPTYDPATLRAMTMATPVTPVHKQIGGPL